ncbi:hypothetical protein IGI04_019017 [Brassica rapa subsp. trilocularis]|uniref:non-specific serine/threonine protein kinase n=1 Tax=Brassica rapa subsp. trilocularis TaxID=1813537 RepID=A0ABQ7MEL6_BRACM|nr:hypothetical protein IGI04_019017 [Brassica rapa subsp. trilocularis]
MTGNSTLPPLIKALEIYTVVDVTQLGTDNDEVSAMMSIKKTYGLSKKLSWQGDPCAPQLFLWEGVNCSYPDSEPSLITSLNLKESGLTGTITSDISKLTQLKELDLSSNDLSGDIPAFFADMKLLKLINLSGNPKLNLTVPESLQERVNSKSLTLILGDTLNPTTLGGKTKKVPVLAIAVPVAGVFALVVILAIFFIVRKKRPRSNAAPRPPSVTTSLGKSETRPSNPSIITKDRRITYPEVLRMTNNFQRVLGKGGFGTVYHGNLDDAQVAVKMLSHSSAQGYKEFKAEVELLLRVHHRHLVGLVGYCDDGDNLALIYEYMANGDLRENMSGKRGGNVLTWENRMQIAVEAAQGLEYLHNGCRPPMVHRDVKTTNILLNERSGAKLADFGLSRSFPIDGECHVSTVVAGTPGYLDPEYYRTNWLSEKSDVYSFGVVLLEIVTNQPVIDKTRERPHINEWVGFMLTKGDIRSIVDPKLMGDYDTNCAWKIVELALGCVNPSSNQRPTMAQVVMELNECVALEIVRRQGSQEMYSMGFINVDCGLPLRESPYNSLPTGLAYISDADLVKSGKTSRIAKEFEPDYTKPILKLRYFPDGVRNCYHLNVTRDTKYLIKATFVYGNYDGLNVDPNFDLYLGPNIWTTVSSNDTMEEIIHVTQTDSLQVCLVKTGISIPFINVLELRPLKKDMYVTQSGSLKYEFRRYLSNSDRTRMMFMIVNGTRCSWRTHGHK